MQIGKDGVQERLNSLDKVTNNKGQNSLVFQRLFFGALAGCLMAVFFADSPLLESLELGVLRWQYKIADKTSSFSKKESKPETNISKDIAIVAFDDSSQFDLGIPRFNFDEAQEKLAKVIETIENGNPDIIALDLDIRGATEKNLSHMFRQYHNIVLSVFGSLEGSSDLPAAEFLTRSTAYGYHDLVKESNGAIFRLPLNSPNKGETNNTLTQVPSLSEAVMMSYRAQKGVNKPTQLQLLKPDQLAYINYKKVNYPTYSMTALLDPSFDSSVFKGRIVLIGSTLTTRKQDPSSALTPLRVFAPEILIQADALNTLIDNNIIYSYPKSLAHHIMIVIGCLFGALFSNLSLGKRTAALTLAVGVLILSAQIAFQVFLTSIPVVSLIAMLVTGYVFGTVIFLDTNLQVKNKELAQAHQSMQVRAEEERKRIAEDLHDETLPALSSVARMIDQLGDNGSDISTAQKMRSKLDDTIQEMRRVINDLHPSVLETMGFVPALENLLSILNKELGITFQFENKSGDDNYEIPDFTKLQLYRIVQEALNNVAKHSGAKQVEVCIEKKSGNLQITVADNGKGMGQETRSDSHGLLNIKHRAQLIGANIAWTKAEQFPSGCKFELNLPLKTKEEQISG